MKSLTDKLNDVVEREPTSERNVGRRSTDGQLDVIPDIAIGKIQPMERGDEGMTEIIVKLSLQIFFIILIFFLLSGLSVSEFIHCLHPSQKCELKL